MDKNLNSVVRALSLQGVHIEFQEFAREFCLSNPDSLWCEYLTRLSERVKDTQKEQLEARDFLTSLIGK